MRSTKALVLACLAVLALAARAEAVITVTHLCNASSTTSGNTVACSLTGSTATGNTITVFGYRENNTDTVSSVSDGTNTFTATPSSPCINSTAGQRMWVYYAKNATGLTNPTYTVTFSGTSTVYRVVVAAEVAGVSTTAPFDKETCAAGNTSSVADPGTVALTYNNEGIIEGSVVSSANTTGTGYTRIASVDSNEFQYKVVAGGSWGASAFATANASWVAQAATFTDAVGGGGGGTPPTRMLLGVGK